MDLKDFLKSIKLNEATISMILGALVVLVVGILVINYFRGRGEEKITLTQEEVGTAKEEEAEEKEVKPGSIHKVEKGEHLWAISEKYFKSGYNWVDIAKENSLANANLIEVGQELKIPQVEAKAATVDAKEGVGTGGPSPEIIAFGDPIQGDSYTVERGDNLWGIAVRAYGDGYRWVDIARENKLANPNIIHKGNIFKLPR